MSYSEMKEQICTNVKKINEVVGAINGLEQEQEKIKKALTYHINNTNTITDEDKNLVNSIPIFKQEVEEVVDGFSSSLETMEKRTSGKVSILQYEHLCEIKDSKKIWTKAIQQALDDSQYVTIPYFSDPILIDDRLLIGNNTTLDINRGTIIKLDDNSNVCMLRNRNMSLTSTRGNNISIIGGIFDGNKANNSVNTYLPTDKINPLNGVGGVINMIGVNNFIIKDLSIVNAKSFAIHINSATNFSVENIRFDRIDRDGVHIGNATDFIIRDLFGQCGDDFVALNAWDWYKSTPLNGSILRGKIENIYPSSILEWGIVKMLPGGDYTIDNVIIQNIHGTSKADCFPIQDDVDLETPGYTTTPGRIGSVIFRDIFCKSNGQGTYYNFGCTFRIGTAISNLTIENWKDFNTSANVSMLYLKSGFIVEQINIDKMYCQTKNVGFKHFVIEGTLNNFNIDESIIYGNTGKVQTLINVTGQLNTLNIANSTIGFFENALLCNNIKYNTFNNNSVVFYEIKNILNTTAFNTLNLTNVIFEKVLYALYLNSNLSDKTLINLNGFNFKDGYPTLINKISGYVRLQGLDYVVDASLLSPNGNDIINNSNATLGCGKGIIIRNDENTQWKNLYTGAIS